MAINPLLGSILTIAFLGAGSVQAIAESKINPTVTISQNTSSSLVNQGRVAYQSGRYREAKGLWQQAYRELQLQKKSPSSSPNSQLLGFN